jgi:hypothetical protein
MSPPETGRFFNNYDAHDLLFNTKNAVASRLHVIKKIEPVSE